MLLQVRRNLRKKSYKSTKIFLLVNWFQNRNTYIYKHLIKISSAKQKIKQCFSHSAFKNLFFQIHLLKIISCYISYFPHVYCYWKIWFQRFQIFSSFLFSILRTSQMNFESKNLISFLALHNWCRNNKSNKSNNYSFRQLFFVWWGSSWAIICISPKQNGIGVKKSGGVEREYLLLMEAANFQMQKIKDNYIIIKKQGLLLFPYSFIFSYSSSLSFFLFFHSSLYFLYS